MRRARYLTALPILLLAGSQARADEPPNFEAYGQARAVAPAAVAKAASGGFVASVDEKRGTPSFFQAQRGVPLPAALVGAPSQRIASYHLAQHAALYNLSTAALATASPVLVHDTGHGGIIVVFRQTVDGIEVLNSDMKVLMDRKGQLIALGGALHPAAVAGVSRKLPKFKHSQADAIRLAFKDLYGVAPSPTALKNLEQKQGDYSFYGLQSAIPAGSKSIVFSAPARVKKVLYPMPTTLVPAYFLELQAGDSGAKESDMFAYVIAADDGRLLTRRNLTQYDAFKYRVWADPAVSHGIPADGPMKDYTPHPTGVADNIVGTFVLPSLITTAGFNNPPGGVPDPWLPAGATVPTGNNIDAYADLVAPDGFSAGDVRADATAPGVFDRTYDVTLAPADNGTEQIKAGLTQLFYNTNWLHDWWYDSGFNEAAGVAQMSNFGRGGVEGDPLHAEGQDYGGLNNANMSTPSDGMSPRMQMYIWSGAHSVNLDIGAPISASWMAGTASFGAQNFDINGTFALASDGTATPTQACNPIVNNVSGKIAVIDRGTCTFVVKVKNAQVAGAVGVLLLNNAANAAPPGLGGADPTITIPTLSTTKENGILLKPALAAGSVTGHLQLVNGVQHDGDIDNSVIGHEWGHYLHHRLVNCGSTQCGGMSEGWADFDALLMVLRQGDNFASGTFALAQYDSVSFNDPIYYGIRRLPYTRDMSKNPFTFKHMSDAEMLPNIPLGFGGGNNSEVHNTGEIWAEMLFSAYTSLQINGGHTFDEAKRRMSDYVVAGMILTPVEPTYTEQRDAILAAAEAADPADMLLLANEFASRGAGTCAEPPPRFATDNVGIVEGYELKTRHAVVSVKVDDSVKSCDSDGLLDGDEAGKITIVLENDGPLDLVNTDAKVLVVTPGVILPGGDTVNFPLLKPYQKATKTLDIALDNSFTNIVNLQLSVAAINNGSCVGTATLAVDPRVNLDDVVGISTIDTVDSDKPTWTLSGTSADKVWSRVRDASLNYAWVGIDYGPISDTSLESADIKVSANGSFVFTFDHAFFFENVPAGAGGPAMYFDGGLIEITSDGGATWQDVSLFTNPGYGGTIFDTGDAFRDPLGGRMGYVAESPGYPAMTSVSLNFGAAFAGKTVRIRFRAGSDSGNGTEAHGWTIDNIGLLFVDNKPFSAIIPDAGICNGVPVANAGPDQAANVGDLVPLDGSKSSDPNNDPLTYSWTQLAGTAATLINPKTATPVFLAPDVMADEILTFQLTVSDGTGSAGDTVDIVVKAKIPATSATTGAGGMGGMGGMGGFGGFGGMGSTSSSTSATTGATTGDTTATTGSSSASGGDTGGAGGAGGGVNPAGGGDCGCAVVGADTTPTQTSMLASLIGALGLLFRRTRRSSKRDRKS